ncbi:MAG TPA: acyltransferase [Candidatus Omnitrophota bacterium]|nr:acyltransferase [Candidatus Omnitrophota bacterium]
MASSKSRQSLIAPSALIHPTAKVGSRTKIWAFCQVAEHASIGTDCILGNGVYIDRHVKIGDHVRIHNKALLYHGVVIENDVFIGPATVFTNDPWPRSGSTRDLKGVSWIVGKGAVIGANVTVLPDVSIGKYATIGAGAVVTKNVPPHTLVYGNPARFKGYTCTCGYRSLTKTPKKRCPQCKTLWPSLRGFCKKKG